MTRSTAPLLPLRTLGSTLSAVPKHVHWFRWAGDDQFGNGSLYSCRCGAVRPGF
jgi:hypothetical protein